MNVAKAAVAVARTAVSTAQLTASNKASLAARKVISDYEKKCGRQSAGSGQITNWHKHRPVWWQPRKICLIPRWQVHPTVWLEKLNFARCFGQSFHTANHDHRFENDHIYANFAMTEKKMLELSNTHHNQNAIINNLPAVELQMADGSIYPQKGKVATISGVIDQETGSVNVRAEFANSKGLLRSGGARNILIPTRWLMASPFHKMPLMRFRTNGLPTRWIRAIS